MQTNSPDLDSDDESDTDDTFTDITVSSYYNNTEFKKKQLQLTSNNPFTIVTINLDSLRAKHSLLSAWLCSLTNDKCLPDAILCQETRLHSSEDTNILSINGYNLISRGKAFKTRGSKGGLAIYLKECYQYNIIPSPDNTLIWENLFIEVNGNNLYKPIYILNIYRYQRINNEQFIQFQDAVTNLIEPYAKKSKQIVIGGDFNLNFLDLNSNTNVSNFYNSLKALSIFGKITQPSRITTRSATAIDNLFCNLNNNFPNITSGIITTAISDHLMCFISIPQMKQKVIKGKDKITIKSFNEESLYNLNMHILKSCITEKMTSNNANHNYNLLTDVIQEGINCHVKQKTFNHDRKKHKINNWISNGIIRSINKKNRMLKKFIKLKLKNTNQEAIESSKSKLNSYKKVLNRCIRNAKKLYYEKIFNACDSTKATWAKINEVLHRKKSKKNYPTHFTINNTTVTDKSTISNEFNHFFSNIGKQLSDSIPSSNNITHNYYLNDKPHIGGNLNFTKVTKETVSKIIKQKLKDKKSCGKDNISSNLLKQIEPVIINPLTKLINQCLETGQFPDQLKIAKVIPLHKKEDASTMNNYRPISLLPAISKIFERIMYDQIYNHMTRNKLLYSHQYGFREKHSTEQAAQELLHTINMDIDKGDTPLAIFLDLSKAFDTINHSILLQKLEYYGITGNALELCKDYLTNRKQYVHFSGSNSNELTINTGVPQGSILGPLFFLIYINDINKSNSIFHPISYADDTTLYTTINKLKNESPNVEVTLNNNLQNINMWLCANKLSLNVIKTKYMIFSTTKKKHLSNINIKINNTEINRVNHFNFLGLTIDENLNWKEHLKNLSNKLSRTTGILNMLKSQLPGITLKTIYNSLFLSHINYGISCWGYTHQSSLKPIITLQKKAIRIITFSKYNCHTAPLFQKLNTLKLVDILKINEFKLYYKYINNQLPDYHMANLVQPTIINITRAKVLLKRICTKTKLAERDVFSKCPLTINSALDAITDKAHTHTYKSYIKYIKNRIISEYKVICFNTSCTDQTCSS